MARRSYSFGREGAKVTPDPAEALDNVAAGRPVVLVSANPTAVRELLQAAPDREQRERLLGLMVGDPSSPEVMGAAAQMASELWSRPAGASVEVADAGGSTAGASEVSQAENHQDGPKGDGEPVTPAQ